MSGELERRWDDAVETAWRGFRQWLADRMAEMEESFTIGVAGAEDDAPHCSVCPLGDDIEVMAECADVPDGYALIPAREVDRAAVFAVDVLRNACGAVHPAWLVGDGIELDQPRDGAPSPSGSTAPALPAVRRESVEDDDVVTPRSVAEVRAVVDAAVAPLYDEVPQWDDDGDLGLPTEHHVVWVTPRQSAPRLLLHCSLLADVADEQAARVEANLLNRKEFGLTFAVRDRRMYVMRELGLEVVRPSVLRAEIERLLASVDEWAADLAERVQVGEEPPAANESAPSRFSTAYAVMVELERGERGSVGPATLVRIFEQDTGMLLRALRLTEQGRREARRRERDAEKAGRARLAKMFRARQDYLRGLASRIRAALRLLVEAPVRKVELDQLALFSEDECGTARDD